MHQRSTERQSRRRSSGHTQDVKDNRKEIDKMTAQELVGYWADFMENKTKLRKPLSKLGEVRIHKNRAKAMAYGTEGPNNYSIIMLKVTTTKGDT
eukprot:11484988-Heterocapsa_arctica.AAC.1